MKIKYSNKFKWLKYVDRPNSGRNFLHFYLQTQGIDVRRNKVVSALYFEYEDDIVFQGIGDES